MLNTHSFSCILSAMSVYIDTSHQRVNVSLHWLFNVSLQLNNINWLYCRFRHFVIYQKRVRLKTYDYYWSLKSSGSLIFKFIRIFRKSEVSHHLYTFIIIQFSSSFSSKIYNSHLTFPFYFSIVARRFISWFPIIFFPLLL